MIQHDSSVHRWSPYANEKWSLIASLDDCSRYFLYSDMIERKHRWDHIVSLKTVWLVHVLPLSYYVDSHSIFQFVEKRDSVWRKQCLKTDKADPQWKRVMNECRVKVTYTLSPQAKGKIERPYRWLQDRLVRTCAREGIRTIDAARDVLRYEVHRYNQHQAHSTTGEIPILRFERTIREGRHLFRPFKVPFPFESVKREPRTPIGRSQSMGLN